MSHFISYYSQPTKSRSPLAPPPFAGFRASLLAGGIALLSLAINLLPVRAQTIFYATTTNMIGGDVPNGILKFDRNGTYAAWDIHWDQPDIGFYDPRGISFDAGGNVYVNDSQYIFKIDPAGNGSLFATKPNQYYSYGVTVDVAGYVYAVGCDDDNAYAIYKYNAIGESIATWSWGYNSALGNLTIGPDGAIYAGDWAGGAIYRIDNQTGERTVYASMDSAGDVAFDLAGNLYAVGSNSSGQYRIFKITSSGDVSNAVTNGLYTPYTVALNASGNIYVSDKNSNWTNEIRLKTAAGAVNSSTVFTALNEEYTITGIAMVVPEPSTGALLILGGLGCALRARTRRKAVAMPGSCFQL